jgi:hypothetical protein
MVRLGRVGLVLVVALIGGCGAPQVTLGPDVPISLYGRNATPLEVWLAVDPITGQLQSVGFGRQVGVACWTGPSGSRIVVLDHSPGTGPTNVIREIAPVHAEPGAPRQEVWVDVAADGNVSSGPGVPPWWPEGSGGC